MPCASLGAPEVTIFIEQRFLLYTRNVKATTSVRAADPKWQYSLFDRRPVCDVGSTCLLYKCHQVVGSFLIFSLHLHLFTLHKKTCSTFVSLLQPVSLFNMQYTSTFVALLSLINSVLATPVRRATPPDCASDPTCGPIAGQSSIYSNYNQKSSPFPANMTAPVPATSTGPPGEDDLLFQNLLSAEWAVYNFYQQGVEAFNDSSFVDIGLPNTTYQRIAEIRDNEAGHLRIFQDSISSASLKPGACRYEYGFTNAMEYLALQNIIEVASMAFLTGLAQQAKALSTQGALVALGEVEARHEVCLFQYEWLVPSLAYIVLDLGSHRRLGPRSFRRSSRHLIPIRQSDPLPCPGRIYHPRKLPSGESALSLSVTEAAAA